MGQLQEQIQLDLSAAIKNNSLSKETLKVIVAEMSRGKDKEITNEKVISIIRGLRESAIICDKPLELLVYDMYLPLMMSEQGVKDYVGLIIETEHLTSVKDLGKVMAHIKTGGLADQIDNKLASQYAKEILSK